LTGVVSAGWVVGGLLVTGVVARRGIAPVRLALAGPPLAAAGSLLLAWTRQAPVGIIGLVGVGVGTSLLTTRVFTGSVAATPPDLLARFQSMLGLAQTMPLLGATPLAGHLASRFGVTTALVGLAAVLLATTLPAHHAEHRLPAPARPGTHHDPSRT
jgi:hypothetical protein